MSDIKRRSSHELRQMRDARTAPVSTRRADLDRYKAVIAKGQRNFVETGTALGLIRRDNLFREDGYATFEAMVQNAFDMSTTTAYRLVEAARVVTILSQLGTRSTLEATIKNQAQALALAPLVKDREAMARVIDTATARADRLTADLLTEVRIELYPATRVIDGESREGGRREIEAPPVATEPEPDEYAACEACGAPLSAGIVASAQYRCLDCDPERIHFAPDHGQPCVACTEPDPAPTNSLAGQPQVPDVPEVSPLVAHDQPETSHPSATGEAPVEVGEALPGAGAQPADDAHKSAVDEPGGGMAAPPSGDPEAITAAFEWVAEFIEGIDADVGGPLLSTGQLARIDAAVDLIVHTAELLGRWHAAAA